MTRSLEEDRSLETLAPMLGAMVCLLFAALYVGWIGLVDQRMSDVEIAAQLHSGEQAGNVPLHTMNSESIEEFSARSTWAVSAMVYMMSLGLVLWVAWAIRRAARLRSTCPSTLSKVAVACAALLMVAGVLLVNNNGIGRNPFCNLQETLFGCLGEPTHARLACMTRVGNVLTGAALAAIPLAAFKELEECHHARTGPERVDRLRKGCERMRALFYTSCAMLASGTVEVWTLLNWPAMHVRGGVHDALLGFARAFASLVGATFTVYLAAVFLSAAFVIRRLSMRLGAAANPEMGPAELHEWALKNGLSPTVSAKVLNALAALAPLVLGGVIGQIVSAVSGQR